MITSATTLMSRALAGRRVLIVGVATRTTSSLRHAQRIYATAAGRQPRKLLRPTASTATSSRSRTPHGVPTGPERVGHALSGEPEKPKPGVPRESIGSVWAWPRGGFLCDEPADLTATVLRAMDGPPPEAQEVALSIYGPLGGAAERAAEAIREWSAE